MKHLRCTSRGTHNLEDSSQKRAASLSFFPLPTPLSRPFSLSVVPFELKLRPVIRPPTQTIEGDKETGQKYFPTEMETDKAAHPSLLINVRWTSVSKFPAVAFEIPPLAPVIRVF